MGCMNSMNSMENMGNAWGYSIGIEREGRLAAQPTKSNEEWRGRIKRYDVLYGSLGGFCEIVCLSLSWCVGIGAAFATGLHWDATLA